MPIRTRAVPRPNPLPNRSPDISRPAIGGLIAAGALYGAVELLVTIFAGGFLAWGRAEALLFLAWRPWLLLAAAAFAARLQWKQRLSFYLAALLSAALSESLFLIGLGASNPWPEAGRGLLAGTVLLAVADPMIQLGRRMLGRFGAGLAAAALGALLLVPGALRPYERIVLGLEAPAPAERRDLMLLSSLPLIWGETGPLDPNGRSAAIFPMLEREFAIRSLDAVDEESLKGRLLLVAQPRALAPSELVALDDWVRRGGRALILTDPALYWPSELPLGDIRRPPPLGLLTPLLDHWGLRLERPDTAELGVATLVTGGEKRRLATFAAGGFVTEGEACIVGPVPQMARCRIGEGEAVLLGDADMLHDRLWTGPGRSGSARHARTSDNPLIVADLLDELGGEPRRRTEQVVEWLEPGAEWILALALALLPLILAAAPAAGRRLLRSR